MVPVGIKAIGGAVEQGRCGCGEMQEPSLLRGKSKRCTVQSGLPRGPLLSVSGEPSVYNLPVDGLLCGLSDANV